MSSPVHSDRFDGSVVVVTGSTRGIGEGIAKRFASRGATVVITGRSGDAGDRVAADIQEDGGDARFVRADVREPADIESLVAATAERYGAIDVLVNNAGVQTDTAAHEATLEEWNLVVETNLRAYWLCAKHAVERMPEGGSVVNVSSNHAFLTMPGHFPYNAVKAGIDGMTRAMAVDFGPMGIRVNTVNPGWILVERTERELPPDRREHVESIHPVGRLGTPADVAGVVCFLASDEAAFVTGASVLVDGGRTAVMQDDAVEAYDPNP